MSVELSWLTAVSWHGEVVWKLPKSCTVKNERLRATAEHALNQELKDINNCKTFFALVASKKPFETRLTLSALVFLLLAMASISNETLTCRLWFHLKMLIFVSLQTSNAVYGLSKKCLHLKGSTSHVLVNRRSLKRHKEQCIFFIST